MKRYPKQQTQGAKKPISSSMTRSVCPIAIQQVSVALNRRYSKEIYEMKIAFGKKKKPSLSLGWILLKLWFQYCHPQLLRFLRAQSTLPLRRGEPPRQEVDADCKKLATASTAINQRLCQQRVSGMKEYQAPPLLRFLLTNSPVTRLSGWLHNSGSRHSTAVSQK